MKAISFEKNAIWIIPLLFLFFSIPAAWDFVFHYPDEKYYTDAVLQMMEKGDYLTPYKADGTPRFLKPIVTYWVVMASYKVLGISPFSSRILFWLAGGILVLVTYLMTKSLTGNRKTAATAALITAANPLVMLSSSRSIPDILLVLFLTLSAWGFLEIMARDHPAKKWFWMAYMGAALAFETKGIPAIAFASVSIMFLLLNPWKRKKISELIEPVSMIFAVLVALSWLVAMYFKYGTEYFSSFYDDQVGDRISSMIGLVFKNGFLGILNLAAFAIPWTFIVLSKPRSLKKYITEAAKTEKAQFGFIVAWILLIILMAAAVFKFYDRYVLPVIPLVSMLFAQIIINSETRLKTEFRKLFFILNALVIGIGIFYSIFVMCDLILITGLIISIILVIIYLSGKFRYLAIENIIAFEILLLFFNTFILMYPLLMPNPGKQLSNSLKSEGISKNDKVYVYGNIRAASNLRIQSGNSMNVVSMDTVFSLPAEPNHFLVINKEELKKLNLTDYELIPGSEEWQRLPADKFKGRLQITVLRIKDAGTKYFIAKPKQKHEEPE